MSWLSNMTIVLRVCCYYGLQRSDLSFQKIHTLVCRLNMHIQKGHTLLMLFTSTEIEEIWPHLYGRINNLSVLTSWSKMFNSRSHHATFYDNFDHLFLVYFGRTAIHSISCGLLLQLCRGLSVCFCPSVGHQQKELIDHVWKENYVVQRTVY